jgi:hypothetical protein
MPLGMLLERAGPDAVQRLPYQGKQALLYFAQLQHIFGFAPDDGGAVLLKAPLCTGLDYVTSPTPKAVSRALALLPLHDQVDLALFVQQLPDDAKLDIAKKFQSVEHFLRSHGLIFFVSDDSQVVMRMRHKRMLERKTMSLEDQLELALRERDKKKIRKLRRQLAIAGNADHPLLNPDNFAKEVFTYIPKKGHVSVKALCTKLLPPDLLNFMPNSFGRFFKNYPQYFQLYEFGRSTNWVVSRAGNPIPAGAIRKTFTEDDCVSILAELIQARGSKSVSFLLLYLPEGVRDCIKKGHGSLLNFAVRHKQYFSVLNTIEGTNKESACVINLIQMPLRREDSRSSATAGAGQQDDDGGDTDSLLEGDSEESSTVGIN